VKFGDFLNHGEQAIVQTAGFVKGEVNRWAQLQEVATTNDDLLAYPAWWLHVRQGDDIAGGQHLAFHVKGPNGRYEDISDELGLAVPVPTRGIATGDADGDGRLDFAVARQWDAPVFYRNESPSVGVHMTLRLTTPGSGALAGSPAIGAQVRVRTPDGRTVLGWVDGGGGHSGKRSFDVMIGLGAVSGPVSVHLSWRDRAGVVHEQDLSLTAGRHSIELGSQAQEVNR